MMGMELTINPEVIDVAEQNTLENMKGLFGDLRTVLEMCNSDEFDEVALASLMESANEKISSIHETFDMMDMVFGCAFGSNDDDDDEDDALVESLVTPLEDDFDRDPDTGEAFDPE